MNKRVNKIVVTGGPCAGKSSAMVTLIERLTEYGFYVVVVPEVARDFLRSNLTPDVLGVAAFQEHLMRHIMEREARWQLAATQSAAERIVLLCDRGALDAKAYMEQGEFFALLSRLGIQENWLRYENYDAVLYLRSAAHGADAYYTVDGERRESAEEARDLDERTLLAWVGHPHVGIVESTEDFEEKKLRVVQTACRFLGIPVPIEDERKFRVCAPDLSGFPEHRVIPIEQHYLVSTEPGVEHRVRRFGEPGSAMYFLTTKRKREDVRGRPEAEERITEEAYEKLLRFRDPRRQPIVKNRTCFVFRNQYFELDDLTRVRPGLHILEIELTEGQRDVVIPPYIEVIEEVTDDPAYTNYELAAIA